MTEKDEVGIRSLKNQASRIVDEVREKGSKYVVTKRGRPVAVIRPWREEDERMKRRERTLAVMARLEELAQRVARSAGRRSAETAVSRQRR